MDRRNFLAGIGAAGTLPLFSFNNAENKSSDTLRIKDVQLIRVTGTKESFDFPYQNQVNPLTVYPEYTHPAYPDQKKIRPEKQSVSNIYLKIIPEEGPDGFYGLIDPEAAHVVLSQLRSFLIGKNPLATETLWDQMYRMNRHSRAGHYMMAISAVDNALWDLKGKYFNEPVYKLLGGPTMDKIEFYASCLGFSVLPEDVIAKALSLKNEGYRFQKWFFAYGLADGKKGLLKNVELVKVLRENLGDEYGIMFDAYNGWDLDYAMEWAQLAEQYRPGWIEEAFISDKPDSFAELRRSTSIPVATGEHFYGRWEVAEFLKKGALDYIQADPEWCGGVSELVKICNLASVFDVRVVPHGHNIHAALHVVASQSPATCPLGEFLLNWMPSKTHFEKFPLIPENGFVKLPTRAGFGIELDEKKVEKTELVKL